MKPAPDRSYVWLFWVLAVIGLTTDQVSKYGIFTWLHSDGTQLEDEQVLGQFTLATKILSRDLPPREPFATRELKLFPGTFDIVASHTQLREEENSLAARLRTLSGDQLPYVNRGALFGWGGGRSDGQDLNTIFALVSALAAVGITFWSTRRTTRGDWMLCAALGLILAGTLGNLYDRVVFFGVRDFLHWNRWFDWPVFNIADCCLVVGAGGLLAHAFFAAEKPAIEPSLGTAEGFATAPVVTEQPAPVQAAAESTNSQ